MSQIHVDVAFQGTSGLLSVTQNTRLNWNTHTHTPKKTFWKSTNGSKSLHQGDSKERSHHRRAADKWLVGKWWTWLLHLHLTAEKHGIVFSLYFHHPKKNSYLFCSLHPERCTVSCLFPKTLSGIELIFDFSLLFAFRSLWGEKEN